MSNKALKCCGGCDEHIGEVKTYTISGWSGDWNYCDVAFNEDKRRGLKICLKEIDEE